LGPIPNPQSPLTITVLYMLKIINLRIYILQNINF
jgi:hypothetical protein